MKTMRGPLDSRSTMRGVRSMKPREFVTNRYSIGPQEFVVFIKGAKPWWKTSERTLKGVASGSVPGEVFGPAGRRGPPRARLAVSQK